MVSRDGKLIQIHQKLYLEGDTREWIVIGFNLDTQDVQISTYPHQSENRREVSSQLLIVDLHNCSSCGD